MPIVWSKEYATGVEEMDNQHKSLVMIINRIEQVSISSTSHPNFQEKVKDVLKDVRDYTVLHFSSEEIILKMFNYPDFVAHKEKHDKFVDLINKKKENIESLLKSNSYDGVVEELKSIYKFLGDWIIVHIQKNDFEYAAFLEKVKKRASGGLFGSLFG